MPSHLRHTYPGDLYGVRYVPVPDLPPVTFGIACRRPAPPAAEAFTALAVPHGRALTRGQGSSGNGSARSGEAGSRREQDVADQQVRARHQPGGVRHEGVGGDRHDAQVSATSGQPRSTGDPAGADGAGDALDVLWRLCVRMIEPDAARQPEDPRLGDMSAVCRCSKIR